MLGDTLKLAFALPSLALSQLVSNDGTLRFEEYCLTTKHVGNTVDQMVWFEECGPENRSRFAERGMLIEVVGNGLNSQESGSGYCLKIQHSQRISAQFVKMDVCDDSDHSQMFEYKNGRVTNHIGSGLCASVDIKRLKDDGTAPWVFSKCYGNVFGQFDRSDDDATTMDMMTEEGTTEEVTTEKVTTEEVTTEEVTTEEVTTEEITTEAMTTKEMNTEPMSTPEEPEECSTEMVGCYIDPVQGQFTFTKLNQDVSGAEDHVQFCIETCKSAGYRYSGLNRGTECFCGDALPPTQSSDSDCDSCENYDCGGFMRVSVFEACGNGDETNPETTSRPASTTSRPSSTTNRPSTTSNDDPTTTRPAGEMTDLERYISTTDEAYSWVDNNWNIYGNDFMNLADYNWITLTSQQYLNDTYVENGIWRHNVILCVGKELDVNAADVGMMWLSGYGVGPDVDEYPKRQQEFEKTCEQAARLGTVGVILDGVPTMVKFHDADEAESEGFQITGASYYFDGDADISAIAEFPEAKAVSMTMNMVDEYVLSKGLRSSPITRWSVTGGSKRGGATLAVAAAEPRVAVAFPVIQNVFHAMPEVFAHDLNCLGGYNSGWAAHQKAGWYRWFLTESDKRQKAELSLNLNKYHKERMVNLPMQFLLGSQDMMMHIDNINVWWDQDWAAPQKSSFFIQPNQGHSGGKGNDDAMYIMIQALINNEIEALPYLDWSYSNDDTLKVCLVRPTTTFTGKLYRGISASGRDFRGRGSHNENIFEEVANCDGSMNCETVSESGISFSDIGDGCYEFEDSKSLNGKYSAMFFTVYFETSYIDGEGDNLIHTQSSGPLVRPNNLPFAGTCTEQSCDLTGIDKV